MHGKEMIGKLKAIIVPPLIKRSHVNKGFSFYDINCKNVVQAGTHNECKSDKPGALL